MSRLKVLIADKRGKESEQLYQMLKGDKDIIVVGFVESGKEAFDLYKREKPDVLIFDLLLPIYDGYTLIDMINEYGHNNDAKLIMTTPMTTDLLITEAFNRGVDYILTKPYEAYILPSKVKKIYFRMKEINEENNLQAKGRLLSRKNTNEIITKHLNTIGVPTKLKGYRYITTAINVVLEDSESIEAVTKILYPEIAKKHNSTSQRVEKAIRHAIKVTWEDKESKRPTNTEFLSRITQQIMEASSC